MSTAESTLARERAEAWVSGPARRMLADVVKDELERWPGLTELDRFELVDLYFDRRLEVAGNAVTLPPIRHPQLGEPIAVYRYERASGDVAFVIARFEPKDFRPAQLKQGRWVWNLHDAPALLYRFRDVDQAIAQGDTVWIVDGEKDADALAATGATATCCARAQGWTVELAEQLTGARRVRIVADRDANGTGRRQAHEVARLLVDVAAIASADIEIVEAREGKDAADHLAGGYLLEEFQPLGLEAVADKSAERRLRVVPFDEFVSVTEESARPLVGDSDSNVIAAGADVLLYGDGGVGKTSFSVDAVAHFASGTAWHGLEVPEPLKVLIIENEGPRGPFRQKLDRKAASWAGTAFRQNVHVLEEPWGAFTLADEALREELATVITDIGIDLVVAGPLSRLGTEGGGTLVEVAAFEALVADLRSRVPRPFAGWLVHHENKAGEVSGAWERAFDTILHFRAAESRSRSLLRWQKARWAPPLHGDKWTLAWGDGETYEVVDRELDRPERATARAAEDALALEWITAHVTAHYEVTGAGLPRGKAEEAYVDAQNKERGARARARRVIDEQIRLADQLGETPHGGDERRALPTLAIRNGETRNGKYLYPFIHAPSPFAEHPNGEHREHTSPPSTPVPLASSPPPREEAANGEHTAKGPAADEIERLAALAQEYGA
jgi:hypothetical protein